MACSMIDLVMSDLKRYRENIDKAWLYQILSMVQRCNNHDTVG